MALSEMEGAEVGDGDLAAFLRGGAARRGMAGTGMDDAG